MTEHNPYLAWHRYDSVDDMERLFDMDNPVVGGADTETTGLHIIKDKPFLVVFGWIIPNTQKGRVFSFYPTKKNIELMFYLARKLKIFMFWNGKFDLHMFANIGHVYNHENLLEGTVLARLTKEAIASSGNKDKKNSLALKHVGYTHVSTLAEDSEKLVKRELTRINEERTKILVAALKQFPLPVELGGGFYKNGKPKTWTKGAVEDFLRDITHDINDLPEEVREVFLEWRKEHPPATYKDVFDANPAVMRRYAEDDIITMLEFYKVAAPVCNNLKQIETLKRENKAILPLWRMERVGMRVDRIYLERSRLKLKAEIIRKRKRLSEIAGQPLKIGQHQLIRQIYRDKFNIHLPNADKKTLKMVARKYKGDAQEMAKIISDLRRLEKWYSTYCLRILEVSAHDGRFYTQFNQSGAVSGRISSDSQQFPKERILTDEGYAYEKEHGEWTAPEEYELFYPRKAFIPTDQGKASGYTSIWYCDFSQIELRCQADYTIAVSGGDLNLCRAYMPFKCFDKDGNEYDFRDPEKRKEWKTKEWFDENGNPWVKTDVHAETAHNALIALNYECIEKYAVYHATDQTPIEAVEMFGGKLERDENGEAKAFAYVRGKGKTFNFMANYGGGVGAAMDTLDIPESIAIALLNGYKTAFPHVAIYQRKVQERWYQRGYVENRYGRKYVIYAENARIVYKLSNYLVQGTCADMMKECIIRIDEMLRKKMAKSRMLLTVHDELQFEIWKGEEWLIRLILDIMEDHPWHLVPIVCDAEVTYTTWADKKAVDVE